MLIISFLSVTNFQYSLTRNYLVLNLKCFIIIHLIWNQTLTKLLKIFQKNENMTLSNLLNMGDISTFIIISYKTTDIVVVNEITFYCCPLVFTADGTLSHTK